MTHVVEHLGLKWLQGPPGVDSACVAIFARHAFHHAFLDRLKPFLKRAGKVVTVDSVEGIIAAVPDILISGESIAYLHLRWRMPWTLFVHTRHGLADKGVPERSFRAADFVCLSSEWMQERFESRGIRPRRAFWPVGYLQMDALQRTRAIPSRAEGRKTVLYAPTFQRHISSIPMLGERVAELLLGACGDRRLVIRPHPLTATVHAAWLEHVRALAESDPRVELVEGDTDVVPLLARADVLVSDCSSVYLEFLALDRPILLLQNPRRGEDPNFQETGLEWEFTDCALRTGDAGELPALVDRALRDPGHLSEVRQRAAKRLFGDTLDGGIAARLSARVLALRPTLLARLLPGSFKRLWGTCVGALLTWAYQLLKRGCRR